MMAKKISEPHRQVRRFSSAHTPAVRDGKLGEKLGLTFQKVQKYEKGTNQIGASRLQHVAQILRVPVSFFFEGVSSAGKQAEGNSSKGPIADFVSEFLATSDGLALTKAFTAIKDSKLRRRVVDLVEEIADDQG